MNPTTTMEGPTISTLNAGDNTYGSGANGISILEDVLTTPNGITMNAVGISYDSGTSITSTTWDDISTRISQLSAIAPNGLNATILAVNNTVFIENADTAPTRVISISTDTPDFGISWEGDTLPFVMTTLDATPLQVKDTSFVLLDSVAPLTTTMTATNLTSGATTRTWADILASSGSTNNLQQVLDNGNSATGASATISLTNSGVGGTSNPSLVLTNSNATINTNPTIELNKTGRNLTGGESVGSISMYGLDATAQKTEFGRIQIKAENVASGNEDGTLSIFNSVNGSLLETFNFNGAQNENNSFRPLDMNGNAVRTSLTNLTLDALSSTGTGDVIITPKTNLRVGKTMLTNDKIQNLNSASASSVDFASSPFNKFEITKDKVELNWDDQLGDQSEILIENDLASKNNVISQFYQSPTGNIQTIIQSIPTIQKIQQIDSINNWTATYYPIKIDLVADSGATTTSIKNKDTSSENRIDFFKNQGGGISCSSGIVNNNIQQRLFLTNADNALAKSINIYTDPTGLSGITHSNTRDANPFSIFTDTDLVIESTKVGGTTLFKSANGAEIEGTNSVVLNATTGVGGSITLAVEDTAGDLLITSTNLEKTSSGGSSGKYLRIKLNGTYYKIALDND